METREIFAKLDGVLVTAQEGVKMLYRDEFRSFVPAAERRMSIRYDADMDGLARHINYFRKERFPGYTIFLVYHEEDSRVGFLEGFTASVVVHNGNRIDPEHAAAINAAAKTIVEETAWCHV